MPYFEILHHALRFSPLYLPSCFLFYERFFLGSAVLDFFVIAQFCLQLA